MEREKVDAKRQKLHSNTLALTTAPEVSSNPRSSFHLPFPTCLRASLRVFGVSRQARLLRKQSRGEGLNRGLGTDTQPAASVSLPSSPSSFLFLPQSPLKLFGFRSMGAFCLHVYLCTTYVPGALGAQKKVSDRLGLEQRMIVRHHVVSETQTRDLWKSHREGKQLSASPRKLFILPLLPQLQLSKSQGCSWFRGSCLLLSPDSQWPRRKDHETT